MDDSTQGVRRVATRALPPPAVRAILRAALDPYLFYTATLTPIVVAVAVLGQRPGEPLVAVALGVAAVSTQLLLSLVGRVRIRPSLGWQLLRLAVPLAYVAAASHFVGGPALPLIALYIPIVAGASAIGRRQGIMTAAVAAVFFLLPALSSLDSPQAVPLRGISLAGVTFVVAFGTRRIVRALEDALARSRAAVIAERRRARQIEALESVGRVLASTGPGEGRIDQVLGVIVEQFRYEHVSLYLGDGDRVHLVAQRGYLEAIQSFHASSGVAGRVMRTRQLAFVPDVSADPDYIPGTPSTTSLISAPLAIEGRFLGVSTSRPRAAARSTTRIAVSSASSPGGSHPPSPSARIVRRWPTRRASSATLVRSRVRSRPRSRSTRSLEP